MLWQEPRTCGALCFFFYPFPGLYPGELLWAYYFEATLERGGGNAFPEVKGDEKNCTAATFNIIPKHDKYSLSAFFLFIEGSERESIPFRCSIQSEWFPYWTGQTKGAFHLLGAIMWFSWSCWLWCSPFKSQGGGVQRRKPPNNVPSHIYLISAHHLAKLLFWSHYFSVARSLGKMTPSLCCIDICSVLGTLPFYH